MYYEFYYGYNEDDHRCYAVRANKPYNDLLKDFKKNFRYAFLWCVCLCNDVCELVEYKPIEVI